MPFHCLHIQVEKDTSEGTSVSDMGPAVGMKGPQKAKGLKSGNK